MIVESNVVLERIVENRGVPSLFLLKTIRPSLRVMVSLLCLVHHSRAQTKVEWPVYISFDSSVN